MIIYLTLTLIMFVLSIILSVRCLCKCYNKCKKLYYIKSNKNKFKSYFKYKQDVKKINKLIDEYFS